TEIFGIIDRFPENQRLDINRTLKVNERPIIKHMIHERHCHQREEHLKENRGSNWNDVEKRRKHVNARHSKLRDFLRNYIDTIVSKDLRTRKRIYNNDRFAADEDKAPMNVPN
ncbi:16753_t:CDS:2, partial [Funneliformis caledonium]